MESFSMKSMIKPLVICAIDYADRNTMSPGVNAPTHKARSLNQETAVEKVYAFNAMTSGYMRKELEGVKRCLTRNIAPGKR